MTVADRRPQANPSTPGTPPAPGGNAEPVRSYTVEKGDTLSHIAKQFYGKAGQWQTIFEANRDQIADPDLIQPGQVLRIPPAPRAG